MSDPVYMIGVIDVQDFETYAVEYGMPVGALFAEIGAHDFQLPVSKSQLVLRKANRERIGFVSRTARGRPDAQLLRTFALPFRLNYFRNEIFLKPLEVLLCSKKMGLVCCDGVKKTLQFVLTG